MSDRIVGGIETQAYCAYSDNFFLAYFLARSILKIKCGKSKGMKQKVSIMVYGVDRKKTRHSGLLTVWHHSASLVMSISDPRDSFFHPHQALMKS